MEGARVITNDREWETERQDGRIVSQKEKNLGHFEQEGLPAVLDSAGKTRRVRARKKSLALAVR